MAVPISLMLFLVALLSSPSSLLRGVAGQAENLRDPDFVLDEDLFLDLLTKLIAAAEFAQQPAPIEKYAADGASRRRRGWAASARY